MVLLLIITLALWLNVCIIKPQYIFRYLIFLWWSCSINSAGIYRCFRHRFRFICAWVAERWSSANRRMLPNYSQHYRSHFQSLAWAHSCARHQLTCVLNRYIFCWYPSCLMHKLLKVWIKNITGWLSWMSDS